MGELSKWRIQDFQSPEFQVTLSNKAATIMSKLRCAASIEYLSGLTGIVQKNISIIFTMITCQLFSYWAKYIKINFTFFFNVAAKEF